MSSRAKIRDKIQLIKVLTVSICFYLSVYIGKTNPKISYDI